MTRLPGCFQTLPLRERLFVRARLASAPLEVMAALAPEGRIADVGCGHGALSALLLERGDLTARQREYALAAAVAGYLGSGRAALAREALEENDDLVAARFRETSWMRFLRAAASR